MGHFPHTDKIAIPPLAAKPLTNITTLSLSLFAGWICLEVSVPTNSYYAPLSIFRWEVSLVSFLSAYFAATSADYEGTLTGLGLACLGGYLSIEQVCKLPCIGHLAMLILLTLNRQIPRFL